jgi:hypothetical protein
VCCSAYVLARYHISESFIFTDFAKLCGSLGHGPSALVVCCGHMCCCMLLHGTACHDSSIHGVTISPCPSPKQAGSDKIAALKRCAHDFMGQPWSSDNAGLSYLESMEAYDYDTLAIGRLIAQ